MQKANSDEFLREIFSAKLEESDLIDGKMQEAYEVIRKDKSRKRGSSLTRFVYRCATVLGVLFLGIGGTVFAASNFYQKRMEEMNAKQLDEFYLNAFQGSAIRFSREMTEEERERYKELQYAYERDGKFPEGNVTYLQGYEDYTGKGVGLYAARSTLFLPDETLTDEELLQIIDFQHKLVYSIEKINAEIQNGEREEYPQQKFDDQAIAEDAVIAYEGNVDIVCATEGKEYIYVAGTNVIERMKIGESISEPFYEVDFGENVVVQSMDVDMEQGLYVLLSRHDGENYLSAKLVHIDVEGNLIFEKNLEKIKTADLEVDSEGRVYMQVFGGEVYVFDAEGTELCTIELPPYKDKVYVYPNGVEIDLSGTSSYKAIKNSLCRAEDGKVYLLYEENPWEAALALVDPEGARLVEVASEFMPAKSPHASAILKGTDSDFVIWRLDGVYTYNLGDSSAVKVMESYESPFQWEGADFLTLENGQILFIKAFDHEYDGAGKVIPESVRFAYISLEQ